ncbi:outer membrane beta-barrel protein [Dyadobacter sp. 3J3]|uniref:outer membrane beta-barrel protein n=1 Tax=Dyadobacter sp. 3J3 TaxID=2606600 RepID=UPI0013596F06|nr:outer membrane beta-barrel protein [Dyadobacter sp. 3J3]
MKILFTVFFLVTPLFICAQITRQDSISISKKKHSVNYLGFRFGGLASSFSHKNDLLIPAPGKKSLPAWHAGVAMDLFTKTHYNARVELSYLNKGAKETFTNDQISIQSTNRLQYLQLTALPLIIKPGYRKINPYIAFGGYYARRIGIKSKSKTGQGSWENDPVTAENLNVKNDFGYSVSAGVYFWKRPVFELRYEAGLSSVSSSSGIKNRSVILSFSI